MKKNYQQHPALVGTTGTNSMSCKEKDDNAKKTVLKKKTIFMQKKDSYLKEKELYAKDKNGYAKEKVRQLCKRKRRLFNSNF